MTLPLIGRFNASATDCRMYPTFRPDRALRTGIPTDWNAWVDRLQEASQKEADLCRGFLMHFGSGTISSTPTEEGSPTMG